MAVGIYLYFCVVVGENHDTRPQSFMVYSLNIRSDQWLVQVESLERHRDIYPSIT